jgi:hypothetical protein
MKKMLWILAPAGLVTSWALLQLPGCADTTTDCDLIGGCRDAGLDADGAGGASTSTGTGGAGGAGGTGGSAPAPVVCKSRRAGDALAQEARSLAISSDGIVVAGDFQGHISFGGSTLTSTMGGTDTFVAVLDPTLTTPVWNRSFPATFLASTLDGFGNVILAGTYPDTAMLDLGCGPLDASKTSFFVAKLDHATGACVWSRGFAAGMARASLHAHTTGEIYLAGAAQGPTVFDNASLPDFGGRDVVVVKLDANGAPLWSRRYGSPNDDEAAGIALDKNGDVFIVGDFTGQLDLGTGGNAFDSQGVSDIFVARLSSGGSTLWAESFHGSGGARATSIAGGPLLTVGGEYQTDLDVAGIPLTTTGSAFFVARLDRADGKPTWATSLDGMGAGGVTGFAVGPFDEVAVTGSLQGAPDAPLFIAELDAKGKSTLAMTIGGKGTARGTAIAFDGTGFTVAGFFDGQLDATPNPTLSSAGADDVFVLQICTP